MNKKEKEEQRRRWGDFYAAAGVEERTQGEVEKKAREAVKRDREMSSKNWNELGVLEKKKIGMVLERAMVACGSVVPFEAVNIANLS